MEVIVVQDGSCGEWSDWTTCSKSCLTEGGSAGQRSRSRPCVPPQNGGLPCDCSEEEEPCAGPSGKINLCPIDFTWEAWTHWSSCSASCGEGTAHRVRTCTPGRHGGKVCPRVDRSQSSTIRSFLSWIGYPRTSGTEERGCKLKECPDCKASPWSSWSSCSTSCGGGREERRRILTEADPGNPRCDSLEDKETESCNNTPCRK